MFVCPCFLTVYLWMTQVETIGNVYMVVGGAPTKYESHVKDICMGTYANFKKWYLFLENN